MKGCFRRRWRRRSCRIGSIEAGLGAGAGVLGMLLRGAFGLGAPCRDIAPAGDLLFVSTKSRQKTTPAKPPLRGSLRCSQPGGAPNSLRYAPFRQRGASQLLKRAARAPRVAALLGGLEGEAQKQPNSRNSQQPNATSLRSWLFLHSPLESAEQRKDLRARAQRASTSDFARLFERSVAKRVPREPSRPEQRREARCEAKGRTERGRLFAFFLVAQKEGRPPGRTPGTTLATKPTVEQQP